MQGIPVSHRDALPGCREIGSIHELPARSRFESARASHHDEAPNTAGRHACNQTLRSFQQKVGIFRPRPVSADHQVAIPNRVRDAGRVENIAGCADYILATGQFPGIANDGRDTVAARNEFIQNAGADHSRGAEKNDVHTPES